MSHHGHHGQDTPESHDSDQVKNEKAQTQADEAQARLKEGQAASQR
ncbi:MAG: hypothetical protein ACRDTK_11210 [Mycobacterium sp.]